MCLRDIYLFLCDLIRLSYLFFDLLRFSSISFDFLRFLNDLLMSFQSLTTMDKKRIATRLSIAARAKLRSSDLIVHLEELVAQRDLETSTVKDNEPTVSLPDISVTARDLSLYRYLVGSKNLVGTKKFLEMSKKIQNNLRKPKNCLENY